MKFIVVAIGSEGDINPMIVIARELIRREYEVEFLANPYFQARVEGENIPFVPLGDIQMFEQTLSDPEIWHPRKAFYAVWRSLKQTLGLTYEVIASRVESEKTALIGTTLAFACRVMQEKTHLPLSTVHLSPSCLISRFYPPVGPYGALPKQTPQLLKDLYVHMLDRYMLDSTCRDDINCFRAQFGLHPVKNIFSKWLHSTDQVICAFPEWFASREPDWPPEVVFTNFPLLGPKQAIQLSNRTREFLKDKPPPVVFTAGSAMSQSSDYFEKVLSCISERNIRAILVSKFSDQIPRDLPTDVLHTTYEPFDLLFPQALAVGHHGGIGTSAQCMTAGVAQLITPFAHDQFDNAVRLEDLGVARTARLRDSSQIWSDRISILTSSNSVKESLVKVQALMKGQQTADELIANAIESFAIQFFQREAQGRVIRISW
ncbi:MAG: glycosyltransferase [Candidatus Obscuribacterales bacterium]|nr:glycosyltransferase [Candidatus Obscuribacterales bacterium]